MAITELMLHSNLLPRVASDVAGFESGFGCALREGGFRDRESGGQGDELEECLLHEKARIF